MNDDFDERRRLPLPSEDGGDLVQAPPSGETDDPLVASEEGVPYVPPADPVLSQTRFTDSGPDVAGTAPTQAGELEREDDIQLDQDDAEPGDAAGIGDLERSLPTDEQLAADVIEQLRDSNVPAGDQLQVAASGSTVVLRGRVESIDVLEELLGLVGDVPGVDQVVDEVEIDNV
jgi:hypothetical protein